MLAHLGEETHHLGAVTPPIFQTSLFVHPNFESFATGYHHADCPEGPYTYSRVGNPNLNIVEKKVAALEGAEACKLFASGMAAISAATMSVLKTGDHIVCIDTAYGPTRNFLGQYLPRFGITTTFVEGLTTEEILAAVRPETKLLYLESPSSILFRSQDYRALSKFCKGRGIVTIADNTYCSGINQRPIEMGIDLVCHSATKFFSGHSDVCAGTVCGSHERIRTIHADEAQYFGSLMPPFPAWLVMRGLRTLPLRLKQSAETAEAMFGFLKGHPAVDEIFHAGDPDRADSELIRSQMSCFISLMTFIPKTQEQEKIVRFVEALKLFQLGVSWGGHESLIVAFPMEVPSWGKPRWVVRLYGGLEHPDDLVKDLDQAMRHLI